MFVFLIGFIISATKPEYLTERKTLQLVNRNTPAWTINFSLFEKVLLAKPENGGKIKIVLPDYNSEYQEYEVEPDPIFAKATLDKYPGQLYAFHGNVVGKKEELINIVYCFRSLKAHYVGHYQTIEMDQSLDGITVLDIDKNIKSTSRSLLEENNSELNFENEDKDEDINIQYFPHRNLKSTESSSNELDPNILFDTHFTELMNDIKVIKFLPFPTLTYANQLNTNRGLSLFRIPPEDLKKNIFSSMALSISFLNRMYLPLLSIRFEMQFDMNMISLDYYSKDAKAKYISPRIRKDYNENNNVLDYALKYFRNEDIDIGLMFSVGSASGIAAVRGFRPYSPKRISGYAIDYFNRFGIFEYVLTHEIGHQLGTGHSFTYKANAGEESTEAGSGVTIMGYPGKSGGGNDVELARYPYFTWVSTKLMIENINYHYFVKSIPKSNRKPVIGDIKTKFVIPTGTAFLLNGTATDPDGDTLYYLWEQSDQYTGVVSRFKYSHNLTSGPIIRNYNVVTESHRFVPKLERIKAGTLTDEGPFPQAWETVPTVPRTINFAFVVRDRKLLSGEAGNMDVKLVEIKVVQSEPFKITSFSSSASFSQGSTQNIQWNVGKTADSEINTKTVTIKFASDGINFDYILASKVPNNGSASIVFPSVTTRTGRIMIQGDDNIFISINTADITLR